MTQTSTSLLVIFGATGDLAQRMLLPALHSLHCDGLLPADLRILACARGALDDGSFRAQAAESLERQLGSDGRDRASLPALLERISYRSVDVVAPDSVAQWAKAVAGPQRGATLYHLSTAPRLYAPICAALAAAGLAGPGTRVLLEKPIGHGLADSIGINDGVAKVFREDQVFRVDHYLGKEGVQNLLALRFGNALFEPLWNARHVEQVQITVAETVGVEGRAAYYDGYGAMRDMVQNHLLQLLCLTAMEPPSQFEPTAVRNEKIKVLRSLRLIHGADIAADTVTGQYAAGAIGGAPVPGYPEELGRPSDTETFVALRAHVDNWRWSGVPFYLRTGKRLPRRTTEIYLQFRAVPHSIFGGDARVEPNALVISLQPDECIALKLMNKTPGLDRGGILLSQVTLDLDLHSAFRQMRRRSAYERLYLDAIEGNGTLFVRRDEVEAAWSWVDEILGGWRRAGTRPKPYPAGTWGPSRALALTERHGHSWRE